MHCVTYTPLLNIAPAKPGKGVDSLLSYRRKTVLLHMHCHKNRERIWLLVLPSHPDVFPHGLA
jgi:hypothetical protein